VLKGAPLEGGDNPSSSFEPRQARKGAAVDGAPTLIG